MVVSVHCMVVSVHCMVVSVHTCLPGSPPAWATCRRQCHLQPAPRPRAPRPPASAGNPRPRHALAPHVQTWLREVGGAGQPHSGAGTSADPPPPHTHTKAHKGATPKVVANNKASGRARVSREPVTASCITHRGVQARLRTLGSHLLATNASCRTLRASLRHSTTSLLSTRTAAGVDLSSTSAMRWKASTALLASDATDRA